MCVQPQYMHMQGIYKEDLYGNKKKGESYDFPIFVKCGSNCNQCNNLKSNNWTVKNYYESKSHQDMCFITLTYSRENYSYVPVREDITKFIKRLRRYLQYHYDKKIRYFGICEYGKRTARIHWHLIIYGWKEDDKKLLRLGKNKKNNAIYRSATISKLWKYGIHSYQEFEKHEIPYIAMYNAIKKDSRKYLIESRTQLKKLEELIRSNNKAFCRPEVLREITRLQDKLITDKKNFIKVKEFNIWSQAIGFDKFYEQYKNDSNYLFTEYFDDRKLFTPTEWLKKLAIKYQNEHAINEIEKRTEYALNQVKNTVLSKAVDNIHNENIRLINDNISHNMENYEL